MLSIRPPSFSRDVQATLAYGLRFLFFPKDEVVDAVVKQLAQRRSDDTAKRPCPTVTGGIHAHTSAR